MAEELRKAELSAELDRARQAASANLRGLRESGNIFAVPTYLFVGLALLIVATGISQILAGTAQPVAPRPDSLPLGSEPLGILLVLRAFAGGSVALTGVEAIANGVPAFKPPESRNAANTMAAMAVLLGILFVGLTVVSVAFGLRPTEPGGPSIVAMAAEVTLVTARLAKLAPEHPFLAKPKARIDASVLWLESELPGVLSRLPERTLSFLEVTAFCLATHLPFRDVRSIDDCPNLLEFSRAFGERPSAKATEYRFDRAP